MKLLLKHLIGLGVLSFAFSSCGTPLTTSVVYQSVRTVKEQPTKEQPIPDCAKIAVAYTLGQDGSLNAVVFNRTSEIMVVDQTKSFFVNSDGRSTSYYDPTVRTTSTTDLSSKSKGGMVNLGAVGNALGIGGTIGSLLNGINVGGSGTSGQSITNASYISDQPQVSLAPKSNGAMSKVFKVSGLGTSGIMRLGIKDATLSSQSSPVKFSVCISYSVDNGQSFDKIVTDFYVNASIFCPVTKHAKINDEFRYIFKSKPDALHEDCWMLGVDTNRSYHKSWLFNSIYSDDSDQYLIKGLLYDFQ